MKHIVFPTDFSESSRSAIRSAAALARRFGSALHLLHVVEPLPWPAQEQVIDRGSYPTLQQEIRESCRAKLLELASQVGGGLRCEIHLAEGRPADEVERFVTEQHMDLVALPTRGLTGLTRFMLGSTAEKVARSVACPVLVLRARPESWDSIAGIIVAVDFSPLSRLAVEEAVELARPTGAKLHLVHAVARPDPSWQPTLETLGIEHLTRRIREAVEAQLQQLGDRMVADPATFTTHAPEGPPSATIVDLAEAQGADLIVIGTHGRQGLSRVFLGSTAERVVRAAPCSILVVKSRGP